MPKNKNKKSVKETLTQKFSEFESQILPNIKVADDFIDKFLSQNQTAFDSVLDLQETFDISFHSSLNVSSEDVLKLLFKNRKKVSKLEDEDFLWYQNLIKKLRDKINIKINELYIEQGFKLKDSLMFQILKERFINAQSTNNFDDDDGDNNSGGNYQ